MSTIDDLFSRLRLEGRKALMPFVTAGDPDLEFTQRVLRLMVARGASLCELGIPYSDPIADGPVIQSSYTRALRHHQKLADIFRAAGCVTAELPAPLVSMVSYAIVYRHGLAAFVAEAKAAGFAGAIVPDLPVEEAGELATICREADFSLIPLITPTTSHERALRIAEAATGLLYYVSIAGITGERRELPPELIDNVGWLRERTELPVCIGFGISSPEHVRKLAPYCDGLIVGSAVVRRIAEADKQPHEAVLEDVGRFIEELVAAL
jgi:tryptophan synthase alpha chain